MRFSEFGPLSQPQPQSERGVADRSRNIEPIARPDAGALRHAPRLDRAEGGDRDRQRPRRLHRVAADQRTAVARRVLAEPGREGFEPGRRPVAGQRESDEKADRLGPLGGQIREIDPQRLARDRLRRIVGEEVHARDQRVGCKDEFSARGRRDERDVVVQPEPGRAGERREIARDQFVFAGAVGHGRGLGDRARAAPVMPDPGAESRTTRPPARRPRKLASR